MTRGWRGRRTGSTATATKESVRASARGRAAQLTTAFTALHFLDASKARDNEVERRFGGEVLARLQADRKAVGADRLRDLSAPRAPSGIPGPERSAAVRGLDRGGQGLAGAHPPWASAFGPGLAGRALARAVGRSVALKSHCPQALTPRPISTRPRERSTACGARGPRRSRASGHPRSRVLRPGSAGVESFGGRPRSVPSHGWTPTSSVRRPPRVTVSLRTVPAPPGASMLERECAAGLLDRLSSALGVRIRGGPGVNARPRVHPRR